MRFDNNKEIKEGTIVLINSKEWYDKSNKNIDGYIKCGTNTFVFDMVEYCGKKFVVDCAIRRNGYEEYKLIGVGYNWTKEMFKVVKY